MRLLFAALFSYCVAQSCKFTDVSGKAWDFSALSNPSQDYPVNQGEYTYFLNLCLPTLVSQTCGNSGVAGCQTWAGGKSSIGGTPGTWSVINGNPILAYSPSASSAGRQYDITFSCGTSLVSIDYTI